MWSEFSIEASSNAPGLHRLHPDCVHQPDLKPILDHFVQSLEDQRLSPNQNGSSGLQQQQRDLRKQTGNDKADHQRTRYLFCFLLVECYQAQESDFF